MKKLIIIAITIATIGAVTYLGIYLKPKSTEVTSSTPRQEEIMINSQKVSDGSQVASWEQPKNIDDAEISIINKRDYPLGVYIQKGKRTKEPSYSITIPAYESIMIKSYDIAGKYNELNFNSSDGLVSAEVDVVAYKYLWE